MLNRSATSRCQQAFSKPCLVNLISKDTHLVFSMYPLWTTSSASVKSGLHFELEMCCTISFLQNVVNKAWRGYGGVWDIENTRWVSFDIKFTRQGFENACWHREACRAIQHAFSKPSLVNLISKDANLVFYLSVNPLLNTLQTSDNDVIFDFVLIQRH